MRLCLRVGDLLLNAGMPANDIVVVQLRIASAYGLARVTLDITSGSMTISYVRPGSAVPMTLVRAVQPAHPDYTQAQRVSAWVDRITLGLPLEEAGVEFDEIRSAPRVYPWWVAMFGNAAVGAGVALLFTTSVRFVLITLVVGCIADRLIAWLSEMRVPPFFTQVAAALVITVLAALVARLSHAGVLGFAGLDPTLIVVGGIVMLVAGMLFVGAMQDAIDQFYVTAAAPMVEVGMRTAGIVVGLVLGLHLAKGIGLGVRVSSDPIALGPEPTQLLGAFILSMALAVSCYAGRVVAVLCGAAGLTAWLGYLAAAHAGLGEISANAVGALLVALLATLLVRRTDIPGFALVTAGLLPLVPGLSLYNGLLQTSGRRTPREAGSTDRPLSAWQSVSRSPSRGLPAWASSSAVRWSASCDACVTGPVDVPTR